MSVNIEKNKGKTLEDASQEVSIIEIEVNLYDEGDELNLSVDHVRCCNGWVMILVGFVSLLNCTIRFVMLFVGLNRVGVEGTRSFRP